MGAAKHLSKNPPDPIFERILAAMDAKGVTQKDVTEYLGMTSAGFTKWRNRENRSFMKYIDQLSEMLDVSSDYLLSGRNNVSSIYSEQMLRVFGELNETEQKYFLDMINGYKKIKNE